MKTITFLAASSVAALSSPSMAQGAWIAATAGGDRIEVADGDETAHKTGVLYGLAAGYDVRIGSLFAGPEAEATLSDVQQRMTAVIVPTDELALDLSRDLYAGLRVGHPIAPNIALYAKAGYSNLRYGVTYRVGTGPVEAGHDELQGYRVGAGVEYAPSRFFGRVEYRYSDYGHHEDSGIATHRHQVAASVGYRF